MPQLNQPEKPQTPVEKLQALKKRRETLIGTRAALEEKDRQNVASLQALRDQLKTLGVTEVELPQTIQTCEAELEASVKEFETKLTGEEAKVTQINQQLTQIG